MMLDFDVKIPIWARFRDKGVALHGARSLFASPARRQQHGALFVRPLIIGTLCPVERHKECVRSEIDVLIRKAVDNKKAVLRSDFECRIGKNRVPHETRSSNRLTARPIRTVSASVEKFVKKNNGPLWINHDADRPTKQAERAA